MIDTYKSAVNASVWRVLGNINCIKKRSTTMQTIVLVNLGMPLNESLSI